MFKTILKFGLLTGFAIAAVKLLEFSYFANRISIKAYIAIVGGAFLSLGVYLGLNHRRHKVVFTYKEVEAPANGALPPPPDGLLTDRELEVLHHIAQGHSNQEIADKLFVSLNTIKTHTNNIYSKLGVKRRTQALEKARHLRLI